MPTAAWNWGAKYLCSTAAVPVMPMVVMVMPMTVMVVNVMMAMMFVLGLSGNSTQT